MKDLVAVQTDESVIMCQRFKSLFEVYKRVPTRMLHNTLFMFLDRDLSYVEKATILDRLSLRDLYKYGYSFIGNRLVRVMDHSS